MPKKIPMRMCVGCREMRPKKELIRIVRSPEGEISIDMKGKKSGRGAYICYNEQCPASALKHKLLDRALECAISGDIAQTLTDSIKKARPSDD